MADNIELSYPQMTRQREENIQSQQVANAEDVNVELDHIVETYNRLIMLLTGEWGDGTGKIYEMVDNAIAVANEAKAIADNCVKKSGDTLTGLLSCAVVPNSDYNLVNKKYVDDKIITELADPLGRIESLENFRDNLKAEQVKLENTNFSAKNLHDGMTELFISVSSGKATVAAAITGKGIETAADASFKTMADNINAILTFNEGTASGTATPADILSGKTAYARGQLIIGSLNLNGLYDTSDSTATPYDIAIGKVAYGNNGRIVGALNISDEGNISYDTAGVKKIYGYASNKLTVATEVCSTTAGNKAAIGVNTNTGEALFIIKCTNNAGYVGEGNTITFTTNLISRASNGRFIYANEKQTVLDITETGATDYYLGDIQVSDCSNENEVYLHMVLCKSSSTASSRKHMIIVCKLKKTYDESDGGGKIYHWEIDKEGGFWYVNDTSLFGTSSIGNVKTTINISNKENRKGKYGIITYNKSDNDYVVAFTYRVNTGTNSITILSKSSFNYGYVYSWGVCTTYLGYNERFLSVVVSKHYDFTVWLSEDFIISGFTDDKSITPDGNILCSGRGLYDFRGAFAAAGTGIPDMTTSNYKYIGNTPGDIAIVSPSSNAFVIISQSSSTTSATSGKRTYMHVPINLINGEYVIGDGVAYGADENIIGYNQPMYDNISNDGSMYINTVINGELGRDVLIKFDRDYSEVIALEYEGEYYYKGTYTGDLTPGGES